MSCSSPGKALGCQPLGCTLGESDSVLSLATRLTSGYWHIFDSQCGYTVASTQALRAIDLDRVFPRYGYPNDLLSHFHIAGVRVLDVPVRPVSMSARPVTKPRLPRSACA